jgi:ubiquinone/menaquinone biosynthesis C-methylase UbiE
MREELTRHLEKQWNLVPDRLQVFDKQKDHLIEGVLFARGSEWYPIQRGVPCFFRGVLRASFDDFAVKHQLSSYGSDTGTVAEKEQAKTNVTFSDKWTRFKNYGLETSHQSFLRTWYCKKFGLRNVQELREFYRAKQLVLEIGPGSGFNARFMAENAAGTVIAADISDAAFTTFENTNDLPNCHVVQADVMDLPFPDNHFDFVIADGVLHHTPDTRAAVRALYRKVKAGGQMFFYVYKKMGPARQFCDQYIREQFTQLSPEDCYSACESLTELGRELSRLQAKITLEKSIPILGIPAGVHDVQRLLYYNFVKCFWNEAFDYETNNMVNFDWYHPHNALQHSEEEVADWLAELGVTEFAFHSANPNGNSVMLRKPIAAQLAA